MRKGKYFYFTISGDNLDIDELKKDVNLPCNTYIKGEKTTFEYSKEEVHQRTNRWVYKTDSYEDIPIDIFLLEQLEVIINHIKILRKYIDKNEALIEFTIYVEEETNTFNILFNKKIIKLLSKINAKFSLTFIDW